MEQALASLYLYLYNTIYAGGGIATQLTKYSDAISGLLDRGGALYPYYLIFRAVALALVVFYFVIHIGAQAVGRQLTAGAFFSALLKCFVAEMLAFSSFDIVRWMFQLGDSLITKVQADMNSAAIPDYYQAVLARSIDKADLNIFTQFSYLCKALIPLLLCVGCNFVILYMIVSRVLRICVNAALSPIAVADIFSDTRRSAGVRFLKRTFAAALQGAMIMVIAFAVGQMASYMASEKMQGADISITDVAEEVQDGKNMTYSMGWKVFSGLWSSEKKDFKRFFDSHAQQKDLVTKTYEKYKSDGTVKTTRALGSLYIEDSSIVKDFLNKILGKQYIIFLILLFIKMGLIRQSNSMCNVVVGL